MVTDDDLKTVRWYCELVSGFVVGRYFNAVPKCRYAEFGPAVWGAGPGEPGSEEVLGLARTTASGGQLWTLVFAPDGVRWGGDEEQAKVDVAAILASDFELAPNLRPVRPDDHPDPYARDPFPHHRIRKGYLAHGRFVETTGNSQSTTLD